MTAVFPWLTHAFLSDRAMKRKPRRLMDFLEAAKQYLDRDVEKKRSELMETIDWKPQAVARRAQAARRS